MEGRKKNPKEDLKEGEIIGGRGGKRGTVLVREQHWPSLSEVTDYVWGGWYLIKLEHVHAHTHIHTLTKLLEEWGNLISIIGKGEN